MITKKDPFPKTINLTISQENIQQGARGNQKTCPTGLALRKYGFDDVNVGEETIKVFHTKDTKENMGVYIYSEELDKEIKRFDEQGEFREGQYNLTRVDIVHIGLINKL